MTSIHVKVSGASAVASKTGPLTRGMVGVPVTFEFSEEWEGLAKTAVFKSNGSTFDVVDVSNSAQVPWELLQEQSYLYIGVHGTNSDGSIVIPTIWASVGEIIPGADPSGDVSAVPSPPVWAQFIDKLKQAIDSGEFDGTGIENIAFNSATGRWEVSYTDGTIHSFSGFDPSDSGVYSIFKENFESFEVGDDAFGLPGTETADWRLSDTYVKGVRYGVGQEEGGNKYALLECDNGVNDNGAPNRAAFTIEHEMQGKFIVQFDYMPMSAERSVSGWFAMTDFFEIWPFGTTDQRFRVRINYLRDSYIHTVAGTGVDPSEHLTQNGGSFYFYKDKWHRIKVIVEEGRIALKAWRLDLYSSEPEDESEYGFTELKSEVFSKEYLNTPHEIRFVYGPMVGGEPTPSEKWNMGFDNLKVYRVHEGKQGPQGIPGPQGNAGRGIVSTTFDDATGRWITAYSDGTFDSREGYDPVKSSIWSILRENFNSYTAGENTFTREATGTWIMNPSYVKEAYRDVEEDSDGGKYVVFRTTGSSTRVHTIRRQEFCGEYCVEFDYMSLTNGGSVTDFFEVWLLSHPTVSGPLRARVNIKGGHSIHVNQKYTTSVSDKYMASYPLASNTWYRVKISVKVGRIAMKIWERDTGTEPTEGAAGTVVLDSTIVTEELVALPRRLEFVFGSMGATPPDGGYRMGFDNVQVYRDIAEAFNTKLGDIDTALDSIITLQNSYIGGDT